MNGFLSVLLKAVMFIPDKIEIVKHRHYCKRKGFLLEKDMTAEQRSHYLSIREKLKGHERDAEYFRRVDIELMANKYEPLTYLDWLKANEEAEASYVSSTVAIIVSAIAIGLNVLVIVLRSRGI